MRAIVVYESVYGNTRSVAETIAAELGGEAVPVQHAGSRVEGAALLVVGGPTHMHGMASTHSRRMAAAAAREDGHADVEPDADGEPGLRSWLRELPRSGAKAAAFDTRMDRSPLMTGVASKGIARRLHARGYEVLGRESFLVAEAEGPLEEGELERARVWAAGLAGALRSESDAVAG